MYGAALFVGSHHLAPPWPTVVTFGAVLGQCCLAVAFVVFGPWLVAIRSLISAAVVVIGGLLILVASETPLLSNVGTYSSTIMGLPLFASCQTGNRCLCCKQVDSPVRHSSAARD